MAKANATKPKTVKVPCADCQGTDGKPTGLNRADLSKLCAACKGRGFVRVAAPEADQPAA